MNRCLQKAQWLDNASALGEYLADATKLSLISMRNIYKGGMACVKTSVETTVQKGCWGEKDLRYIVSFESTSNAFLFHAYDSVVSQVT